MKQPNNPVRVAEVWRHGHMIAVEPVIPEIVAALRSTKYVAVESSGQVLMRRISEGLVVVGHDMRFLAGLEDLVFEMLHRMGYEIRDYGRDIDSQLTTQGEPSSLKGSVPAPFDHAFLQLVQHRERGLIRYAAGVSPARLIAQAALAYPDTRIICAATRIEDCYRLKRELGHFIKKEPILMLHHRHRPCFPARIVVSTYAHLGEGQADLHNRDLMFVMSPTEQLPNYFGRLAVRDADQSRLFGLLASERSVTHIERDRCTSLFGLETLMIPAHGSVERPIHVTTLPYAAGGCTSTDGTKCDLHRKGVWNNHRRNRHIARLARGIATYDNSVLQRADVLKASLDTSQKRRRVGVYVANIEQAISIYPYLYGWKLISSKTVHLGGLSGEHAEQGRFALRQPNRPGHGIIITPDGVSRVRRCDVVIRADAGVSTLPSKWAIENTSNGVFPPPPVLLIDFTDRFHPAFRKYSRKRQMAYLSQGWRMPVKFATWLDQFLATRVPVEMNK